MKKLYLYTALMAIAVTGPALASSSEEMIKRGQQKPPKREFRVGQHIADFGKITDTHHYINAKSKIQFSSIKGNFYYSDSLDRFYQFFKYDKKGNEKEGSFDDYEYKKYHINGVAIPIYKDEVNEFKKEEKLEGKQRLIEFKRDSKNPNIMRVSLNLTGDLEKIIREMRKEQKEESSLLGPRRGSHSETEEGNNEESASSIKRAKIEGPEFDREKKAGLDKLIRLGMDPLNEEELEKLIGRHLKGAHVRTVFLNGELFEHNGKSVFSLAKEYQGAHVGEYLFWDSEKGVQAYYAPRTKEDQIIRDIDKAIEFERRFYPEKNCTMYEDELHNPFGKSFIEIFTDKSKGNLKSRYLNVREYEQNGKAYPLTRKQELIIDILEYLQKKK